MEASLRSKSLAISGTGMLARYAEIAKPRSSGGIWWGLPFIGVMLPKKRERHLRPLPQLPAADNVCWEG